MKVIPTKTVIDADSALDIIGRSFNFDHAKGIAEWIKNSVDAYNVNDTPDKDQKIIISIDVSNNDYITTIEVIDFCGMTKSKIDKGFIHWFSNVAASLDRKGRKTNVQTLGGHGNGGKFYMRQMFNTSEIITYYDNKLNGFGFTKDKRYGFYDSLLNRNIAPKEAISLTGLNTRSIPQEILDSIINDTNGFTIVRGNKPKQSKGTNYRKQLIDKLIDNPQASHIIKNKNIFFQISKSKLIRLNAKTIVPRNGFEAPVEILSERSIDYLENKIDLTNIRYPNPPALTLYSSDTPLKGLKYKDLNRIDFFGENGVIATYHVNELGNFTTGYTEFIYGECYSPILEDEDNCHVTNDREKLVKSEISDSLLYWIQMQIENYAGKMAEVEKKHKKERDLKNTSDFNKILNSWKDRFLKKILQNQLMGSDEIDGIGGQDLDNPIIGEKEGKNTKSKGKKKSGNQGGDKVKRGLKFPQVLISGQDEDPIFNDGRSFICDPRHPAVYQRHQDIELNIYWINTSKKLPKIILDKESANSTRWRDYLFQRYVDIIIKESVHQIEYSGSLFNAETINNNIDDIVSNIHDTASEDLNDFLFDQDYHP